MKRFILAGVGPLALMVFASQSIAGPKAAGRISSSSSRCAPAPTSCRPVAYLPSYYPSYPAIPTLPSYYPYGSVTYGGGYSGCYGYGYGYNSVAVSGPIYTTGYGINAGAPIVCVDRVAAPRTVSVVTGGETTIISSEAVRSNKPVLRTSR